MSLITEVAPPRDGYHHAITVNIIARDLRKGIAPVVEAHPNALIKVVWGVAPNDPAYGIGYGMREHQRDHLEFGPRVEFDQS